MLVVHDETDRTCHLYSTAETDIPLDNKETAVVKESYTNLYGKTLNLATNFMEVLICHSNVEILTALCHYHAIMYIT